MDDITLLALISKDKSTATRIAPFVKEHSMAESAWDVMQGVSKYYTSYPSATSVNWTEFKSFFFLLKGKVKAEKASVLNRVIDNVISKVEQLGKDPALTPVASDVLAHYIEQDYATRIANISFKLANDDKSMGGVEAIETLCKEYKKEVHREVSAADLFVPTSLSELSTAISTPGLDWRLKELRVSVGPIRQGDFLIVGARPETGKTTFLAENVTHWVTQLPKEAGPIIWVNNEERDRKVMYRIVQSYFGVTNEELQKNMALYEKRFNDEVGKQILVVSDDAGCNNVHALNRLFDEYGPSVIVFDQLDKVVGYSKEARDDLRLGKLYGWARNLAKEWGPVVTASQVSGSGEGQPWITQAMLRGSTTDKAGEADCIITIGTVNDMTKVNERYMHIAKNKMQPSGEMQEAYRHGYFEINIKPEIARFVGSMK